MHLALPGVHTLRGKQPATRGSIVVFDRGTHHESRTGAVMANNMSLPFEPEAPLQVSYGRDILVVDDNQTNLIAIEAALASLGRKLVLAHSGVEALGRLLEQ